MLPTDHQVWLCRDRQTNAERAVKFIKKSSVSVTAGSSLLEEVQVVKSLDHPNIMKLYEFFGDKKYYYLVMEVHQPTHTQTHTTDRYIKVASSLTR